MSSCRPTAVKRRTLSMTTDQILPPQPLTHALVIITNRCNARCTFCQYASIPTKAATDEPAKKWIAAISRLRQAGTQRLVISGGEPLLHQSCNDIVRYSASVMQKVILCTNGTPLDASSMLLMDHSSLQWNISLHGADEVTHDSVTGTPGGFSHITALLDKLTQHSIASTVAFNTTCHDALTDYRPLIRLAEQLQVGQITINPVWSQSAGNCHANAQDLSQAVKDREYAEKHGLSLIDLRIPDVIRSPGCHEVLTGMLINPSGECYPCMHAADGFYPDHTRSFGNAFREPIQSIRSSPRYIEFCRQGYHRNASCCTACHAPVRRSSLYEYLKWSQSTIQTPVPHNTNKAAMPQGGMHYG